MAASRIWVDADTRGRRSHCGGRDRRRGKAVDSQGQSIVAYLIPLHEAGHALGMSGASIPKSILAGLPIGPLTTPAYKESHPTVRESVMNYDDKVYKGGANEHDCSPHPLDVMAVWALYQTITP